MDRLLTNQKRGYLLKPGEGVASFGPDVKASIASTGGAITLIESHTRGGAPRHVHSREDECFYVLDGAILVHCGEDTFVGGPGSFVFLPRGIAHDWDVTTETATLLMITVPAMLEEFLRAYHAAGPAGSRTREEIAAQYGIQFL